jgi:hypothetical protein
MVIAATVLLLGFATSAPAQTGRRASVTPVTPPISVTPPTGTATTVGVFGGGVGRVFTPSSGVVAAGSAGKTFHTNVEVFVPQGYNPASVSPPFGGYGYNTPASIACQHKIQSGTRVSKCNPNASGLTIPSGGSQTIAIVDAYDDPWIAVDLAYFSAQFGLPFSPSQIQVVYASGFEPSEDTTGGWELEESLDVEYAHAMAPNANIVLVEANSNDYSDLGTAVLVASNEVYCGQANCSSFSGTPGQGEVSMSWGGPEYSTETSFDSYFTTTGVVYFAAAGDSPGVSYPCASPNVVCVGGTTISRMPPTTPDINPPAQAPFAGQQQGSWELSGGGSSLYESLPSYQSVLANTLTALNDSTSLTPGGSPIGIGLSTTNRALPDISANGNPYTGYWIFDSFEFSLEGYGSAAGGWWIVGGTSASTPIIAGMTNLSAGPNIAGGASNPGTGFKLTSAAELILIYSNISSAYPSVPLNSNIGDILGGYGVCGPYMGYTAAAGWDPCTGVGVPAGPTL